MDANGLAPSYGVARQRFLAAADAAGAHLTPTPHPRAGLDGEPLAIDVAELGADDAPAALLIVSGTHGVEGYTGSALQTRYLAQHAARSADGVRIVLLHAFNPFGFSWVRRVNEDNVDLNRNFVDHQADYPVNEGYETLREAICPTEWNDAVIAETKRVLDDFAEKNGPRALQKAISGGQYGHAEGIFYGGSAPTWSHKLLKRIFSATLARARHVAVIDYHTGLGPYGYGERICIHTPGTGGLERAQQWYDEDVTSPALGNSASVELYGFNVLGMAEALPESCELTAIALEYGTIPSPEVRLALRADNWLHIHGQPGSAKGRAIKSQIRDAFYQDRDDWKEMVWERAVATQRMALKGLAGG